LVILARLRVYGSITPAAPTPAAIHAGPQKLHASSKSFRIMPVPSRSSVPATRFNPNEHKQLTQQACLLCPSLRFPARWAGRPLRRQSEEVVARDVLWGLRYPCRVENGPCPCQIKILYPLRPNNIGALGRRGKQMPNHCRPPIACGDQLKPSPLNAPLPPAKFVSSPVSCPAVSLPHRA